MSEKVDHQSLSPTPSTSPSIAPGSGGGEPSRNLTISEVIKLLRQSGPSEVADYLERRERKRRSQ